MNRAKEKPLLGGEGLHKRIATEYAAEPTLQAAWLRWRCQAAIFIAEFWRTGSEKHLRAFCRQLEGMRDHALRDTL